MFSVTLMCVSALVEANGLYLEPVIQAIAEQLPSLWERARDSVPIHSCLLSGECYYLYCIHSIWLIVCY